MFLKPGPGLWPAGLLELGFPLQFVSWYLCSAIYTAYFDSLSKYPGPKLWATSRIPSQRSVVSGHHHHDMLALHKQYGNTVRVGPNELAFFSPEGFKDIYTKRAGHKLPPKDRSHYPLPPNGVDNIVTANDEAYHARHRRLLGYAFSEKALKEQEPILQSYVDLFVARLRDQASRGPVDIKSFFNFLIFDITGDLMFGESFGCLEESKLHPWVELFFSAAKAYSYLIAVSQFPWVKSILEPLIPRKVVQEGLDHFKLTAEKVDKRLAMKTERPDIISFALRNGMREGHGLLASESEKTMSRAEMHSNAYVYVRLTSLISKKLPLTPPLLRYTA